MKDLVSDYGVTTSDMCTQDLKDPYRGAPLKKRTGVATKSEALWRHLKDLQCVCSGPHGLVQGTTYQQQEDGKWKTMSLPAFAGGYTAKSHRLCCERRGKTLRLGRALSLLPSNDGTTTTWKRSPSSNDNVCAQRRRGDRRGRAEESCREQER